MNKILGTSLLRVIRQFKTLMFKNIYLQKYLQLTFTLSTLGANFVSIRAIVSQKLVRSKNLFKRSFDVNLKSLTCVIYTCIIF